MSLSISSPVTGGPQTGLTSPTYTLSVDTGPNAHSIQYAVTALGGTQTGVNVHSVSSPFTITVERPANFPSLGTPNPVTGVIGNVPFNTYKVRVRKGVVPSSGQPVKTALAELKISVPAGADTNDAINLRAMLSALFGAQWSTSSALGTLLIDGVI